MSDGSSPLSSPLSQVSTLSDISDEDTLLGLGTSATAGIDADAGGVAVESGRPTRRSAAKQPVVGDGKRKRSSLTGLITSKRPRTRTSSTSMTIKTEQLASSSTLDDELPPAPNPVQRRSARGSIPAPSSPPKLASPSTRKRKATVAQPPVVVESVVESALPPLSKRATKRHAAPAPIAAPESPPSAIAVEATSAPTRLPAPPPLEPVPPASVASNGRKAGRHSVASLLSAPPAMCTSVDPVVPAQVDALPQIAAAADTQSNPTPAPSPLRLRSEPGVELSEGLETCPMCRDKPTVPSARTASVQPSSSAAADGDVTMADKSANALGLSPGPAAPQEPSATVAGPSSTTVPAIIVDSWLSCVRCKRWHHYECIRTRHPETLPEGLLALGLSDGEAANKIDRWYCTQQKCAAGKATLKKEPKEPKRASSRAKPQPTYAPSDDDSNAPSPTLPSFDLPAGPVVPVPTAGDEHNFHRRVSQWPELYATYERQGRIIDGGYRRCSPEDVVDEWAREDDDGWRRGGGIILVDNERSPDGEADAVEGGEGIAFEKLGGRLPDRNLTVADVARINGPDIEIEVLSVDTQNRSSAVPGTAGERWTLAHWARYYIHPAPKVLFNIISYEISGTTLGKQLEPPKAVKELSWVDRHWPSASAPQLPPVQRYLLMSPAGTFTDWHVDMAASSVYYHVVRGEKVFYFIRPTVKHLTAYRKWASTEKQTMEWLGNSADEVYKVVVKPGMTAFIPAGWIHSVYTPKDSLVYGGNFVHTLAIPMQLRVCEIEVAHGEEDEHRFPYFIMLCWFVAKDYTAHLASLQKLSSKAPAPTLTMSGCSFEELTPAVLESLLALARYLCDWVERRVLKKLKGSWTLADSKQLKRDVSLKDPFTLVSVQLANEFRSRVVTQLKALGQTADESAGDVEARETSLAQGAKQAAGSSSVTSHRATGVKDKSPRATEGLVENWTEPEILKYAASRPRPGAPAGAPSESAMCTEEKQHQFQYQRPQHRTDGSAVLEFVTATRVRYRTTWAPPTLPPQAPAPAVAAPAPAAISGPARATAPPTADLTPSSEKTSAPPIATVPRLSPSGSLGSTPASLSKTTTAPQPAVSARPVNDYPGPQPPSASSSIVGGPSVFSSSSATNGQRPIGSIGSDTSRTFEHSNGLFQSAPASKAGPSNAAGSSTATSSAISVSTQRRPSANGTASFSRAAEPPTEQRPSIASRLRQQQQQQQTPLWANAPQAQTGHAPQQLAVYPQPQQQPTHASSSYVHPGPTYLNHSHLSSSAAPARPYSHHSGSHQANDARPFHSGPYAAGVYALSAYPPQSFSTYASYGQAYDAGRRPSVSPPKPHRPQASSAVGFDPAGQQQRPSAFTSGHNPAQPTTYPGGRV